MVNYKKGMSKHPNLNIPVRAALLLIVVRLAFHFADINWPEFQMIYLLFDHILPPPSVYLSLAAVGGYHLYDTEITP